MEIFKAIQIQTVTGCNRKCPWCPNGKKEDGTHERIDMKLYEIMLDQLSLIGFDGRFSPYLMNEPLLDEDMGLMIKLARGYLPNAEIMLNTNGDLADKNMIERLIRMGLDSIYINCYDAITYDKTKNYNMEGVYVRRMYYKDDRKGFYNRAGKVKIIGKPKRRYCERPFEQMYIDHKGNALLCCSDYDKEVIMGNIKENTLLDIWGNQKYTKYRGKLKRGIRRGLKLCESCNYPRQ